MQKSGKEPGSNKPRDPSAPQRRSSLHEDDSSTILSTFAYQGLEIADFSQRTAARVIRVLVVIPELSSHGFVQCQLRCEQLSNQHTALSYTWGSEVVHFTILLNGQAFRVRRSLYEFLEVARRNHHTKALWIDAICIDQRSPADRNEQVRIMAHIYAQAKETLIWLGSADSQVEDALEQLSATSPFRFVNYALSMHNDDVASTVNADQAVQNNALAHVWEPLVRLCNLPYWSRTWVVQEWSLSCFKKLLYGASESSEQHLERFYAQIDQQSGESAKLSNLDQTLSHNLCVTPLYLGPADAANRDLETVYRRYRNSECSDFHDRIYALRAMFTDGEIFPIEYSLSKLELVLSVLSFQARHLEKQNPWPRYKPDLKSQMASDPGFAAILFEDFDLDSHPEIPDDRHEVAGHDGRNTRVPRFVYPEPFTIDLDVADVLLNEHGSEPLEWMTKIRKVFEQWLMKLYDTKLEVKEIVNSKMLETVETLNEHPTGLYLFEEPKVILLCSGPKDHQVIVSRMQLFAWEERDVGKAWIPAKVEAYGDGHGSGNLPGAYMVVGQHNGNETDVSASLVITDSIAGVLFFALPADEKRRNTCVRTLCPGSQTSAWTEYIGIWEQQML